MCITTKGNMLSNMVLMQQEEEMTRLAFWQHMTILLFSPRNSAPEIVVTREALPRQPMSVPAVTKAGGAGYPRGGLPLADPPLAGQTGSRAAATGRIEERINRARHKMWQQNSCNSQTMTTSPSATSLSSQQLTVGHFLNLARFRIRREFLGQNTLGKIEMANKYPVDFEAAARAPSSGASKRALT